MVPMPGAGPAGGLADAAPDIDRTDAMTPITTPNETHLRRITPPSPAMAGLYRSWRGRAPMHYTERMDRSLLDLTDKVAVITGGSRGIGKAIAFAYAEHGANVVIASRKVDNCV